MKIITPVERQLAKVATKPGLAAQASAEGPEQQRSSSRRYESGRAKKTALQLGRGVPRTCPVRDLAAPTEEPSLARARRQVAKWSENLEVKAPVVWQIPGLSQPNSFLVESPYFLFRPFLATTAALFQQLDTNTVDFLLAHELGHYCVKQVPMCGPYQNLLPGAELYASIDLTRQRQEYAADWFAAQLFGRKRAETALSNAVFEGIPTPSSEFSSHPSASERLHNLRASNASYLHLPEVSVPTLLWMGGPPGWMALAQKSPANSPVTSGAYRLFVYVLFMNILVWQVRCFVANLGSLVHGVRRH